jgi:hypothetical protein
MVVRLWLMLHPCSGSAVLRSNESCQEMMMVVQMKERRQLKGEVGIR